MTSGRSQRSTYIHFLNQGSKGFPTIPHLMGVIGWPGHELWPLITPDPDDLEGWNSVHLRISPRGRPFRQIEQVQVLQWFCGVVLFWNWFQTPELRVDNVKIIDFIVNSKLLDFLTPISNRRASSVNLCHCLQCSLLIGWKTAKSKLVSIR